MTSELTWSCLQCLCHGWSIWLQPSALPCSAWITGGSCACCISWASCTAQLLLRPMKGKADGSLGRSGEFCLCLCLLGSLAVAAPCWSIKFYVPHLCSSSPNHCQSWGPLPAPVCQLSISTASPFLPQTANMDSSPCLNFSRILDPFCHQDRLRYLLYGPQRAQMTVHLLPRRPSLGPEQPKWD